MKCSSKYSKKYATILHTSSIYQNLHKRYELLYAGIILKFRTYYYHKKGLSCTTEPALFRLELSEPGN